MKNILFAILMMVLLSACSNTEKATQKAQTNYNECQKGYYAASELVKVELTDDGKVKSMAVGNQNLRPCQMAQAPKSTAVAMVEVFGSVANNALNVAASSVPYVAMAKIASDGITSAGNNTYNHDSFNSHSEANQANQQTTTTETVSGIKAGGNVDQSQHNQNNPVSTTNTDNNSVNDSNNSNDDNSSVEQQTPEPEAKEEEGES